MTEQELKDNGFEYDDYNMDYRHKYNPNVGIEVCEYGEIFIRHGNNYHGLTLKPMTYDIFKIIFDLIV